MQTPPKKPLTDPFDPEFLTDMHDLFSDAETSIILDPKCTPKLLSHMLIHINTRLRELSRVPAVLLSDPDFEQTVCMESAALRVFGLRVLTRLLALKKEASLRAQSKNN